MCTVVPLGPRLSDKGCRTAKLGKGAEMNCRIEGPIGHQHVPTPSADLFVFF